MDNWTALETLNELMTDRKRPSFACSDFGSECVVKGMRQWLHERKGVEPMYIEPGSPWENSFVKIFPGKLRNECLKDDIFGIRAEDPVVVGEWQGVLTTNGPTAHCDRKCRLCFGQ